MCLYVCVQERESINLCACVSVHVLVCLCMCVCLLMFSPTLAAIATIHHSHNQRDY